jgi:hypothetical protein
MNKNIWGPEVWNFIHTVTINYPVTPQLRDKEQINNFFYSLSEVLPCDECKKHFKQNLKQYAPNVESKEQLFKWGVDIHNNVNKSLGKKILTYEQVVKIYEKKYNMKINFNSKNKFNKSSNKTIYNILFVLLILFILFLYFKK